VRAAHPSSPAHAAPCSVRDGQRRSLILERNLFRRPDQDIKGFVDETRISILRAKD